MKRVFLVLMLAGLTSPLMAQDPIELSEVLIRGANYQYLDAVDHSVAPMTVKYLEKEAALFRAEGGNLYEDMYDTYTVSFFIPDGKIVAMYDRDDRIVKTIERYKNVQLPSDVRAIIKINYPDWTIVRDVYHVNYNEGTETLKYFMIKLENGNKTLRVKIDDQGNYL